MDGVEGHKRARTDSHTHTRTHTHAGRQAHRPTAVLAVTLISRHTLKLSPSSCWWSSEMRRPFFTWPWASQPNFHSRMSSVFRSLRLAHFSASQQSICQSICPPASLFVRPVKARFPPPLGLKNHLSICLTVCPSVSACQPLPVSLCPLSAPCPVNLAVNLSAILSMWLGFISLSICLCIRTTEFGAKMPLCGQKALRCFRFGSNLSATPLQKQRRSK